ncbi:MAG TPA: DUF4843 domain-containing protein [Puia sp.]|jgi:hypothetical protein|nr:DUF4843 domain-containing protein [Puia sp.]
MKNKILLGCWVAVVLVVSGCKPESPMQFSQNPALYFGAPNLFNPLYVSATQFSFATYPNRTIDTFLVQVSLLGNPSPKDRELSVAVVDTIAANATAGSDFKLLPPYVLPANATSVRIPVVLYRTPVLDSISINFFLKIAANENFSAPNNSQGLYNVQVLYLQKPVDWDATSTGAKGWALANLGMWTKTKYELILEALYNPLADSSISSFPYGTNQPPAIYTQYLQMIHNYIAVTYPGNYTGKGPVLLDPDHNNDTIKINPTNY